MLYLAQQGFGMRPKLAEIDFAMAETTG